MKCLYARLPVLSGPCLQHCQKNKAPQLIVACYQTWLFPFILHLTSMAVFMLPKPSFVAPKLPNCNFKDQVFESLCSSPARPCGQHACYTSCLAFGPYKRPLATLIKSENGRFINLVYLYLYNNKIYKTLLTFQIFQTRDKEQGGGGQTVVLWFWIC